MALADWKGLECDNVIYKPSFFWKYFKQSSVNVFSNSYKGKFGVEAIIKSPHPIKLTSIIKPLLDGLISAFHQHDGKVEKDVLHALSGQTTVSEMEIQRLLYDARFNVLGKRSLVHKFRNGVQWNPADDLCTSIKLVCDDNYGDWEVDGKIFSVE